MSLVTGDAQSTDGHNNNSSRSTEKPLVRIVFYSLGIAVARTDDEWLGCLNYLSTRTVPVFKGFKPESWALFVERKWKRVLLWKVSLQNFLIWYEINARTATSPFSSFFFSPFLIRAFLFHFSRSILCSNERLIRFYDCSTF